eukprot:1325416-Pleurochrysis_carterae.AAC.1
MGGACGAGAASTQRWVAWVGPTSCAGKPASSTCRPCCCCAAGSPRASACQRSRAQRSAGGVNKQLRGASGG